MTYCGASEPSVGLVVAERVRRAPAVELGPPGRVVAAPAGVVLGLRRATTRSAMTSRQSPTIGTSAVRFLEISAGSMSAWTIVASGAKLDSLPVTRSSNRAPRRDDQVGLLQRGDRGDRAVHAGHAQVLRVAVGERAAGHQRGHDRDAGELGEGAQLGPGAAP